MANGYHNESTAGLPGWPVGWPTTAQVPDGWTFDRATGELILAAPAPTEVAVPGTSVIWTNPQGATLQRLNPLP